MKRRWIAVVLLLCIVLTGCDQITDIFGTKAGLTFEEMTYVRPSIEQFDQQLKLCSQYIEESAYIGNIVECINAIYTLYDDFYTNYSLADIRYCCDMSDTYWQEESAYCAEMSNQVEAKLEELYRMLAQSSYRRKLEGDEYFGEGFFLPYIGEQMWDAEYTALAEQEVALQNRYYELCADAADVEPYSEAFYRKYGQQFAQILVELIGVRQQLAKELDYQDYVQMQYYGVYDRDYSPQEAQTYMQSIGSALAPLYKDIYFDEMWQYSAVPSTEEQTFAYVKQTAQSLGGEVLRAFEKMEQRKLYDISYSENKYQGAFTVYLTGYGVPFIFTCPWLEMTDRLEFVHEFGHFTNDFICQGSWASTDVAEIQSQGMEYMSLLFANDSKLTDYKMADSLGVYVEQSAFALFEQEIYGLTGDDLTVENVTAIYTRICSEFGIDQGQWDPYSYVAVSHFYTNPMYMISYVVSNDLALQFYQMEMQKAGSGQVKYLQALESEEYYIRQFALDYGLKDPFSVKRVQEVAQFFHSQFK